jgi:flagellar hook-associated protein 1 FlgK
MSLIGALNVSASALVASEGALAVTSNNISNAGNPNYSEEVANLEPGEDVQSNGNALIGTGVDLTSVQRQVDEALNSRLNSSVSDYNAASTTSNWTGQLQSVFNELNGQGLSTSLDTFFNGWSTLANDPQNTGQRGVVVQNGIATAGQLNTIAGSIGQLQTDVTSSISSDLTDVNNLSSQIATLNQQIVVGSGGGQQPNALLDQRDAALQNLSKLVNVTAVPQNNGGVNVYLGNNTLVDGATAAQLTSGTTVVNGQQVTQIDFNGGGSTTVTGGEIGGLLTSQGQLNSALNQVNTLAQGIISEVNDAHASGQGLNGVTSATGANAVLDPTQPLNSAAAGLSFPPTSGSFVVQVTNKNTGQTSSTLVPINLNGSPSDTTLNSLASKLSGITGVTASVSGGKLTLNAAAGSTISFSQDTSGTLAALGINTFFTGNSAATIGVNQTVQNDPTQVAASGNGDPGDNSTALKISQLGSRTTASLGGASINGYYQNIISAVGSQAQNANNQAESTQAVQTTLQAQQQSVSGVSVNQEAINMIMQQRTFQAASLVISRVDAMFTTLLAIT